MIHDLGVVVERIRECFRVRPVAVPEARIIGRHQVIAIGKPCEERLEHPRRRWQSVQQQNRRRIFRPGLSVEDRESVDLSSCDTDVGYVTGCSFLLNFLMAAMMLPERAYRQPGFNMSPCVVGSAGGFPLLRAPVADRAGDFGNFLEQRMQERRDIGASGKTGALPGP